MYKPIQVLYKSGDLYIYSRESSPINQSHERAVTLPHLGPLRPDRRGAILPDSPGQIRTGGRRLSFAHVPLSEDIGLGRYQLAEGSLDLCYTGVDSVRPLLLCEWFICDLLVKWANNGRRQNSQ